MLHPIFSPSIKRKRDLKGAIQYYKYSMCARHCESSFAIEKNILYHCSSLFKDANVEDMDRTSIIEDMFAPAIWHGNDVSLGQFQYGTFGGRSGAVPFILQGFLL